MKVAVVVPTITGREDSLQRTLHAYAETLAEETHQVFVIRDRPCWPAACNAGAREATLWGADLIHYGADDLVPVPGWLDPCLPVLQAGELPAPQVYNYQVTDPPWSQALDGPPGSVCAFTRVPILTVEMALAIGDWPEIIYYADCWVSDKARALGWPTRVVAGYGFVHFWDQRGRLDGDPEAMERARKQYERAAGAV